MSEVIVHNNITGSEIAVIGMAGRFPGAKSIGEFWENLKNGIESISFFTDEELKKQGIEPGLLQEPDFVKTKGGEGEDIELFDAPFFGYSPKEAEIMDPQMRIFHECVWEVLEDAGYDSKTYKGTIGLYAGATSNSYWETLTFLSGKNNEPGGMASGYLNNRDFLSTRIAYKLNLKGPAITIQTACSTSLVAIHLACQAILNGECEMALAGGITISLQGGRGYLFREGMVLSPDGHCRAFDARAKGFVGGNGAGVVLLRPLEEALADRDHIYAVVKGSAVNNDGIRRIGYSAPSIEGQAEAIRVALRVAEVEAESIGYVEAHGTGTTIGDPVEMEGLKLAFNTDKKGFCAIGSIKTNLGHLDAAAGIAGFIKAVLALKHRLIPPSLHFETPNPGIDFENSPFYVNVKLSEWRNGKYPLRAGISAFGIGGTNAHVILEETPVSAHSSLGSGHARDYQLILLSAKTRSALDKMTENLAEYFKKNLLNPADHKNPTNPGLTLADAVYTLQVGRRPFQYRRMTVCSDVKNAINELSNGSEKKRTFYAKEEKKSIIFMFPGLGAQYVNMGLGLYQEEPVFREEMDRCFEILRWLTDYDIKKILYPDLDLDNDASPAVKKDSPDLLQIEISQIAIFIFEYALARVMMNWGITPDAMIGYSFGEYTAACISGVFSLEDTLKLIVTRGRLIAGLAAGSMLSVPIPAKELRTLLNNELSIAIDNGPSCIVAGSNKYIHNFERQMRDKKILCVPLQTSHAIHSGMMVPILEQFEEFLENINLSKPQIPYISNVTGQWLTVQEAVDPRYWSRHLKETVRFADGISQLLKQPNAVFIEIGPGRDLSTLLVRHKEDNPTRRVVNLVKPVQDPAPDDYYLLNKIGQLWLYGVSIDWEGFYSREKRHRIPLPTYSFDRQRYWIDGNPFKIGARLWSQNSLISEKTGTADCFYIPSWKPSTLPIGMWGKIPDNSFQIMFLDESDFSSQLVGQLSKEGKEVVYVRIGNAFKRENGTLFTINPKKAGDYDILLSNLPISEKKIIKIVHLWNLTEKVNLRLSFEKVEQAQELGFYSLVYLARAIGRQQETNENEFQIKVVTNNMQKVIGDRVLCPGKATVLAPIKVIPLEYPNIKCWSIDIELPGAEGWQKTRLRNQLLAELEHDSLDPVVAYRGNDRLVQVYEPVPLGKTGNIPLRLRQKGVYLIINGLKGNGFKIAEYLAQTLQPKLVFIESKNIPQKNEWKEDMEIENKINTDLKQEVASLAAIEEKNRKTHETKGIESYQGLEEAINELCSSFILAYFKRNSIEVEPGKIYVKEDLKKNLKILPKFDKFFDFFINTLIKDNMIKEEDSRIEFLNGITKVEKPFLLLKETEKKYPQFKGTLRLIEYCAGNYSAALSGEIEAISVLFPGGNSVRGKEDYQDLVSSGTANIYFLMLQRLISKVLEKPRFRETFKILEIGAGTGVLTMALVPGLIDKNVQYHFTDIGNFFVINAKKEAVKQGFTFMKFGTFDISKDPIKQGYETNSFDMILGHNVVHTTRSIEESIGNLKQLLVPGGLMCLIESTNPKRWLNMIDGLAEGWWYFEDKELRQNSPLLSLDNWEKVFKNSGFQYVNVFPNDKKKRTMTDCGLIVARKVKKVIPGKWIAGCRGNKDETTEIKDKIRGLQQLEKFGADIQVIGTDPANPGQMKKAIARVEERFGRINGVIHCTGSPDDEGDIHEIQGNSLEMIKEIFVPKIKGVFVLEKILNNLDLDFCVLCSSLNSIYASPGIVAHCAANVFLDYFAHYRLSGDGQFIVSINWDPGLEISIANVLAPILEHSFAQAVFSSRELTSLSVNIDKSCSPFKEQSLDSVEHPGDKYQRPEISSEYAAPGDSIEKVISEIWKEFLGMDQVGIYDDFMELGADSLIFITIAAKIHKEFNINIPIPVFFAKPNIKGLAEYIKEANREEYYLIDPSEKKEYYALSPMQRRLYILHLMEKEKKAYNELILLQLDGKLDKAKLEGVFKKMIQRHESLRTSFYMAADKPVQKVQEAVDFEIRWLAAPGRAHSNPGGPEVESIIYDFESPFDLSHAPLLRVGLIKESEKSHILVVLMHHIITDGTSQVLFSNEFMALYNDKVLPLLRRQYKDYSQWQQSAKVRKALRQQEEYWLREFDREIPVLNIPTDFPRPAIRSFEGNTIGFELSIEETKALNQMARKEEATLFMVLLAIYNIFLSKLSSQEDIIVGTPTAGRNHADLERIIGMFVNTLALRNYPSGEKTFKQLLKQVKDRSFKAFENQNYPFEELVEKVKVERDAGRNPLFDVFFALQNYFSVSAEISGQQKMNLEIKAYAHERKKSKFDLSLYAFEGKEKLAFTFEYCAKLFRQETVVRFINYFKKIVSSIIEVPGRKLAEIEIIPGDEKKQVLFDFNNTKVKYPGDKTIHELFENQVRCTPDNTAIVFNNTHLSYMKLNRESNRLARLLKEKGVVPDDIVGIAAERSMEMIIGILGILKSGAAYLPIDPAYPKERTSYMLADSKAKILLTAPEIQVKVKAEERFIEIIDISDLFSSCPSTLTLTSTCQVSPANLAYVIYTSGSTGKPKGVMIEHYSLVNRLHWMQEKYQIDNTDTILQKTPFTFDVSLWEMFWWCLKGAKLCFLIPGGEKDPQILVDAVEKNNITILHFVPSMLNVFLEFVKNSDQIKRVSNLKRVIASGEELNFPGVEQFNHTLYRHNNTLLSNLYGPTEATVDVSSFDCPPEELPTSIPIGKPINNIKLYIVDKHLHLQPLGIPGELCISGDGLARGYLNRPELTAEKFNHDLWDYQDYLDKKNKSFCGGSRGAVFSKSAPLAAGGKIYKTGDLARWLPDGNIQFLARIDHQVKIRGFRIELGEIESQLLRHDAIKEAVVRAKESKDKGRYLCAYIVSDKEVGLSGLRNSLKLELPDYMVPQDFVSLEKVPRTPNGKIDRRALDSLGEKMAAGVEYTAPGSKMEKTIANIWKEVLNIDKVSIHENFFDIGGSSLEIIKVNSKLRKILEKDITIAAMFRYPTISSLAGYFRRDEIRGFPSDEEIDESRNIMEEAAGTLFKDEIENP